MSRALRTALVVVMATGCADTMTRFAANSTVDVVKRASASFDEEADPWLARQSATGQLKFIEGILKATPDNGDLMVIIAKNYGLYAFAFLVDDLEQLEWGTPEYEVLKDRSIDFFTRARSYAIQRMTQDFEDFEAAIFARTDARLDQIMSELDAEDHVPGMYWLAYAWANIINLQTDEPAVVADLGRVKKLMTWVRGKDAGFENGGPALFFGATHLALPPALGGKPAESKEAFEAGIAITDGRFLMGKALFAHYYMRAVNDRAGYVRLLNEVIDAPSDIMPEQRLANELAKVRARRWLKDTDEYFDAPEGEEAPAEPKAAPEDEDSDLSSD